MLFRTYHSEFLVLRVGLYNSVVIVCPVYSSDGLWLKQATDRTYSVTVKDVDLLWNFVDFSNFICIIKTSIGKENKAKRSSCIGKFHYSDTANLYLWIVLTVFKLLKEKASCIKQILQMLNQRYVYNIVYTSLVKPTGIIINHSIIEVNSISEEEGFKILIDLD